MKSALAGVSFKPCMLMRVEASGVLFPRAELTSPVYDALAHRCPGAFAAQFVNEVLAAAVANADF